MDKFLPGDCRALLQVHDELVFEIKEEVIEDCSKIIVDEMESFPTNYFGVKFEVHGKDWGEEE
jgi:DNA polymerase I-like protein with 3'-5' exonuclease and polymerase domains